MSRAVIATIGILIGAVLALLAIRSSTAIPSLGANAPIESRFDTPERYTPSTPVPLPTMSATQRQRAIDITLGSPSVRKLIEGHPHRVIKIDPMIGPDGSIVGAVVTVGFDSPQTIAGTWYVSSVPCEQRGRPVDQVKSEYDPAPVRGMWTNLKSILIWVNFERSKVYMLLPGDGGKLIGPESYPPGKPTPPICGD